MPKPTDPGAYIGQEVIDTKEDKNGNTLVTKNGEPREFGWKWNGSAWKETNEVWAVNRGKIHDVPSDLIIGALDREGLKDKDALIAYWDAFSAANDALKQIESDSNYSSRGKANAKTLLALNQKTYNTSARSAFAANGVTVNSAGFKNLGNFANLVALADRVESANPPTAVEVVEENTKATAAALKSSAQLEQQYAGVFAEVTGKAQREQALKNIQFALDTPEINAIRTKTTQTAAEKATLAEFDAQFAGKSATELSAMADAAFNAKVQEAKVQQFRDLLPQYQATYLNSIPGAKDTLASLGQLGTQMAQQATQRPNLTAFEQAIAGPELQSKLGTIDQGIVNQYMNTMPGVVSGAQKLATQANADLAAGRTLTQEQIDLATQAARDAAAARGVALGPQAITAEVLNREELANQRYLQRQASAQQALSTISNLYQPALAQTYARQQGAEAYNIGAQGQAFSQALARGEAEANRIQSANTLQANAAQIAASSLGVQQQVMSPILSTYFNVPPAQGQLQTGINQSQNQYAQAGVNVGNIFTPTITGLNMLPYQTAMNQQAQRVGLSAGYTQAFGTPPGVMPK